MFLGIEIGGTKLQLGVGLGDGTPLMALERLPIDAARGAVGILQQIETVVARLCARYEISAVGIGFGGPIDPHTGRIVRSHQIEGWHDFPLAEWCRRTLDLPTAVGNDCDVAALAEARFGAGQGRRAVLYVTVGSGVGGGFILDGQIYRGSGPVAMEIGHLRPGLHADRTDETVEALASGWGIAAAAQARIDEPHVWQRLPQGEERVSMSPFDVQARLRQAEEMGREYAADLLARAGGVAEDITAKIVAQAAAEGNAIAVEILEHACQALGWAIAQGITLLAPQIVVLGGGVSQIGEAMFFAPLREQVDRYVYPPLARSFEIVPAALGESVVVHGALLLAATI